MYSREDKRRRKNSSMDSDDDFRDENEMHDEYDEKIKR